MDRKVKLLVGTGVAAVALMGIATAAGLSYVTAAGDENRWGMRIARRLGIKPAPFGAGYSSGQMMKILERAEFTGPIHIALMRLSDENREEALANFNTYRAAADRAPITDADLAAFTEEARRVLNLLSVQERLKVLTHLNALRATLGLTVLTASDLATPVTD